MLPAEAVSVNRVIVYNTEAYLCNCCALKSLYLYDKIETVLKSERRKNYGTY